MGPASDDRIGDFRLPVGHWACGAVARAPALSPVRGVRPRWNGGRIGRHLVAAASGGDSLSAALHAAADDPPCFGGKSRLAGYVRTGSAFHLLPVGRGLQAEPLEFSHAPIEDGEEPTRR